MLVSNLAHLEYPFFTAIATIFTIESANETKLAAGRTRMLGSLVGAAAGTLLFYIKPGNPVLCGLGMIIVIHACNILGWKKAIPIAGVIFSAIMLSSNIDNPLKYSMNRLLNTFVGIAVAVVIDYLIPEKKRQGYEDAQSKHASP